LEQQEDANGFGAMLEQLSFGGRGKHLRHCLLFHTTTTTTAEETTSVFSHVCY
jgi:hypothetical protein